MAKVTVCDGCEQPMTVEPIVVGMVVKREYCETCAAVAQEIKGDLDALHTKTQDAFVRGLIKLRQKYGKSLKWLPDA